MAKKSTKPKPTKIERSNKTGKKTQLNENKHSDSGIKRQKGTGPRTKK